MREVVREVEQMVHGAGLTVLGLGELRMALVAGQMLKIVVRMVRATGQTVDGVVQGVDWDVSLVDAGGTTSASISSVSVRARFAEGSSMFSSAAEGRRPNLESPPLSNVSTTWRTRAASGAAAAQSRITEVLGAGADGSMEGRLGGWRGCCAENPDARGGWTG